MIGISEAQFVEYVWKLSKVEPPLTFLPCIGEAQFVEYVWKLSKVEPPLTFLTCIGEAQFVEYVWKLSKVEPPLTFLPCTSREVLLWKVSTRMQQTAPRQFQSFKNTSQFHGIAVCSPRVVHVARDDCITANMDVSGLVLQK